MHHAYPNPNQEPCKQFPEQLGPSINRVGDGRFGIAAEAPVGKYGEIAKLPRHAHIFYAFAYVFAMFAASPAPIMDAAFGPPCGFHDGCW